MGEFIQKNGATIWIPDRKDVDEPQSVLLNLPVISYLTTVKVEPHNSVAHLGATICLNPDSYCYCCKFRNSCIYIRRRT